MWNKILLDGMHMRSSSLSHVFVSVLTRSHGLSVPRKTGSRCGEPSPAPIVSLSKFFSSALAEFVFHPRRELVCRLLHQTPSCQIALLNDARACDSKVSLLAS